MITFNSQEEFEEAVIQVLRNRLVVGVTVGKERKDYYSDGEYTNVEVSLFDSKDGTDIDRGSDYA